MTPLDLREQAAIESAAARLIQDTSDEENRMMTDDEDAKFDAHLRKAAQLEATAERKERLEAQEARLEKPADTKSKPEISGGGGRIELTTPERMFRFGKLRAFRGKSAEKDAYYSGKWLMATIMGDAVSRQWCRDKGIEIRVMTEGVNTAGGFVVPDVMERAIIDLRETYGMFRANARVVPMSSDHMNIPRRAGGVTAYFIGETDDITASDKSWNQVEVTAKKLGALTRMSTDLSEDAIINVADDLADEMAYASKGAVSWKRAA